MTFRVFYSTISGTFWSPTYHAFFSCFFLGALSLPGALSEEATSTMLETLEALLLEALSEAAAVD
jgi:hypothetical protein